MRLFGLIIPMMLVVTALAEQKRILADPFDDREFYVSDDHFGSWMARCLAEVMARPYAYFYTQHGLEEIIRRCRMRSRILGFRREEQINEKDQRRWDEFKPYIDCVSESRYLFYDTEALWSRIQEHCRPLLPDSIVPERIRAGNAEVAENADTPANDAQNEANPNNHPDTESQSPDVSAFMARVSRLLKDEKALRLSPMKVPGFKLAPL